jgi:hypothetical protein
MLKKKKKETHIQPLRLFIVCVPFFLLLQNIFLFPTYKRLITYLYNNVLLKAVIQKPLSAFTVANIAITGDL